MAIAVVGDVLVAGLLVGLVYALMSLGLALIYGVMNVINFAHGGFIILGCYVVYTLWQMLGLDPYLSLVVVVPLFFGLGLLTALLMHPLLSRKQEEIEYLSVVLTFGLLIVLQTSMLFIWTGDIRLVTTTLGRTVLTFGFIHVPLEPLIAAIAAVIGVLLVSLMIYRTNFGLAIRALSQSIRTSMLMGVNIHHVWYLTIGLCVLLCGVAGTLVSATYPFNPYQGFVYTIYSFLIVILSGIGSIAFIVLGGVAVGLAVSLLSFYFGSAIGPGLAMLMVLLIIVFKRGTKAGS